MGYAIPRERVLILGGTGFVGRRLSAELARRGARLRILARDPEKAEKLAPAGDVDIKKGDLVKGMGLEEALKGVKAAYYLVHSMGGRTILENRRFIKMDRDAAVNFMNAAETSGLERIIYLGGLGELGSGLSEHLKSRAEIAKILSASPRIKATVLRAAVIIGAGGASFEILRHLVERLPVMVCPLWVYTRIQPIAIRDVVEYLTGCLSEPWTAGRTFDICGPEVMTYRRMMEEYAEARNLSRRFIIAVPFLTPRLSAYWVDLVTPVPSGIAHPLIEGMRNEVVCNDNSIDKFINIKKTGFREAVMEAISEESISGGPVPRGKP